MEDNMIKIQDCNEEDGPYIEIELDHAVSTKIHNDYDDNKNNCIDDEYKLRISISSTISVSLQKESISDEIGASQATCVSVIPYDNVNVLYARYVYNPHVKKLFLLYCCILKIILVKE